MQTGDKRILKIWQQEKRVREKKYDNNNDKSKKDKRAETDIVSRL